MKSILERLSLMYSLRLLNSDGSDANRCLNGKTNNALLRSLPCIRKRNLNKPKALGCQEQEV